MTLFEYFESEGTPLDKIESRYGEFEARWYTFWLWVKVNNRRSL